MFVHQDPEGMLLFFPLNEVLTEGVHFCVGVFIYFAIEKGDEAPVDTTMNLKISRDFGVGTNDKLCDGTYGAGFADRTDVLQGFLR